MTMTTTTTTTRFSSVHYGSTRRTRIHIAGKRPLYERERDCKRVKQGTSKHGMDRHLKSCDSKKKAAAVPGDPNWRQRARINANNIGKNMFEPLLATQEIAIGHENIVLTRTKLCPPKDALSIIEQPQRAGWYFQRRCTSVWPILTGTPILWRSFGARTAHVVLEAL